MDPLLEDTSVRTVKSRARRRRRVDREIKRRRRQTRFERWAWTEIPAYRLGLLLSYTFAMYFGISAMIAGVPAFNLAAPEGWTPIWSLLLILSGPLGLVGIASDKPRFRGMELAATTILSATLTTYAGTLLFLAYIAGDVARVAVGAGFAWLATGPLIRMFWLIAQVLKDRQARKANQSKRAKD